jgi:hypothetical protein
MHTLAKWAYTSILEHPLVFYLGILTYVAVIVTAGVALLRAKSARMRRIPIPAPLHRRLAVVAVGLATLHGLLTLSAYF